MPMTTDSLIARLESSFSDALRTCKAYVGEVTAEVEPDRLLEVCRALRDRAEYRFEQLVDLCGVDYAEYGEAPRERNRFGVVYHLLSITHNTRLRLRVFADDEFPSVESVVSIWPSANWYEREAFDLFGIVFQGHPDLRRLLTDYGFIGHPFRKDFPLIGKVEMRYDPELRRVVYEQVSIEPRTLVPRVIRHDSRYIGQASEQDKSAGG